MDGVRSDWGVSIRRACRVIEVDTSSYHYKSRRRDQAGIAARIREICETRVRYGYRRVHVLLCRVGWEIHVKRTYRIYKALGLQLRNKTPKRRVKAKLRVDRRDATRPNETWAMDFVHDQLATGRKLRLLTVVDTFSRYSPVIDPRYSYRGEDVVQTPDRIRLLPRLNYKWAAPRSSWYISWTQLSNCGEPTARPIALQARCSAGPVKFTATFWSWAWLFR